MAESMAEPAASMGPAAATSGGGCLEEQSLSPAGAALPCPSGLALLPLPPEPVLSSYKHGQPRDYCLAFASLPLCDMRLQRFLGVDQVAFAYQNGANKSFAHLAC
jgi:hypothetical protein